MSKVTTIYVDKKEQDRQPIAKVIAEYGSLRTYRREWKEKYENENDCTLYFKEEQYFNSEEVATFYVKKSA